MHAGIDESVGSQDDWSEFPCVAPRSRLPPLPSGSPFKLAPTPLFSFLQLGGAAA